MREADLLEHIYRRSADLAAPEGEIVVGPGDDCAVVRTPLGDELLITVDQLVEHRHFDPGTPIDLIARKAVARSISDIAAMGGTPAWGLATALLPTGYEHADELFDAMASWARHWGAPLIGGDIATGSQHQPLGLTVTVAGRTQAGTRPLLRSGAQPGDSIWLTGPVGGSMASGRHLRFEPRLEQGRAVARSGRVNAAIDLSDGLGIDAGRVAVASGVRIELEARRIPLHDDATRAAQTWRDAIAEGEDHELLFTGMLGPDDTPIGRARSCAPNEPPGVTVIDPDGTPLDATELGWQH